MLLRQLVSCRTKNELVVNSFLEVILSLNVKLLNSHFKKFTGVIIDIIKIQTNGCIRDWRLDKQGSNEIIITSFFGLAENDIEIIDEGSRVDILFVRLFRHYS